MITDADDYIGGMVTFDIPAGVATQSFTIDVVDDNVIECDERFKITLLFATICNIAIGNDSNSEVIITDNDGM